MPALLVSVTDFVCPRTNDVTSLQLSFTESGDKKIYFQEFLLRLNRKLLVCLLESS